MCTHTRFPDEFAEAPAAPRPGAHAAAGRDFTSLSGTPISTGSLPGQKMPTIPRALRLALASTLALAASLPAAAQTPGDDGDFFSRLAADVQDATAATRGLAGIAALPDGFYLETVASGFRVPVAAAFLPDGRMLVSEKLGRLSLVDGAQTRVVLDLTDEVLENGDRGLLGLAVDPGFAQTGWIYLLYTTAPDAQERRRFDSFGRLTRYTLAPDGSVVAGSRRVILGETFAQGIPTCYDSHAIGTLAFGRDGSLFVGAGDAASYSTVDAGGLYPDCFGAGRFPQAQDVGAFRSQQVTSLAGKILRVDPATGRGYPSNPFYTGNPSDNASRVWALGFRNPYRFSVDPASGSADPADGNPGTVYYGDVGWSAWEEVGVVQKGQNSGWPCREGFAVQDVGGSYSNTPLGRQICPGVVPAAPAFAWSHVNANYSVPAGRFGNAVVGGAVYRGTRYPAEYRGRLFYADYARGWVASARIGADGGLSGDALFDAAAGPIVSISYDPATQNLFFANAYTGTVQRLRHTAGQANSPPVAVASATPTQGGAPLVVRFTGSGSSDPDGDAVSYAWAFGNGQTSAEANPTMTYGSSGDYTARLTVTDARGASASATVAIVVRGGSAPVAVISSPAAGAQVLSGQTLALVATGTDADPGQTATLAYAWEVTLLHLSHQHPGAFQATGATASYAVPFHGDAGESYGLLVRLTVTDATGFRTTAERTVAIGQSGGETDVTAAGAPVALVMAPTGAGSRSIETIRDGVTPDPRTGATTQALARLQYDSYDGLTTRQTDWIGYTFDAPHALSRLRFHEGVQFGDGGWFEAPRVEVRVGGTWRAADGLVVTPAYRGADGQHFDAYDFAFTPVHATGVRLIGRPGGAAAFISTSELRVFSAAGTADGPLPSPWTSADIGPVYGAGSAGFAGDAFTVRGGGDVWGDVDHFHYVWQPLSGDGTLTARITGLAGANPWAKAGLMIRASTAGNSAHAMLIATPGNGTHLQYRRATGAQTDWTPGPALTIPTWLRITRAGAVVTAFTSADGQTWVRLGSASVALGQTALIGMMSTSTDYSGRNDVATATFTDVTLTAGGTTGGGTTPADITAGGAAIASVTAPQGGGSRSLDVLSDGVAPSPTTVFPGDLAVQYDTYTSNTGRAQDYFGYTFPSARTVSRVLFTEGAHFDNGGWFETLGVEVRIAGTWRAAVGLAVTPSYPAVNDGRHFDAYSLSFTPVQADGVRIVGRPGGSARFTSVSELRVVGQSGGSAGTLPSGWTAGPVGQPAVAGTTTYAEGLFTVRGNGDIWGDADRFEFVSQPLSGDGAVSARLESVVGQNPWAKTGLMIRAGRGTSAPHAMIILTPGRGAHFQYRAAQGGTTGWQAGPDALRGPVWLSLQRTGDVFTAMQYVDGGTWAVIGQATIAMPRDVLIGLATTATDYTGRGDLATAVFSNVLIGETASATRPGEAAFQTAPEFSIESVFPNPTRGLAAVRLGVAERGTYRVELLDMLGRRVFETTLVEDAPTVRTVPVDLSAQPAGIYALRVFAEGGRSVMTRLTVIR